jgi:choline-sulfatase
VPLLLEGPGIPAGRVIETPVHGVDLAPTLLALMGIASDVTHDGLDLSVLWQGGSLPERALFGEADHTNIVDGKHLLDIKHMVRCGTDKLHYDQHTRTATLFDLGGDPGELRDLASERPARARELLEILERFRASAVEGEAIPAPGAEERRLLEELGYGGESDG